MVIFTDGISDVSFPTKGMAIFIKDIGVTGKPPLTNTGSQVV
jgi:hypothetical protein